MLEGGCGAGGGGRWVSVGIEAGERGPSISPNSCSPRWVFFRGGGTTMERFPQAARKVSNVSYGCRAG